MDDLAGLDWNASANNKKPLTSQTPSYPSLRPSPAPPASGRSTPLSTQSTGAFAALRPPSSKPATPANDSFANLLGSSAMKASTNLTLAERQKQLLAEKARQQEEQRRQFDNHFGVNNSHALETLGSGTSSPAPGSNNPFSAQSARAPGTHTLSQTINRPFAALNGQKSPPPKQEESEEDILAAFNSAAPVDASSHYPPPIQNSHSQAVGNRVGNAQGAGFDDDDDPFGLGQMSSKAPPAPAPSRKPQDDDDILGMLGRPETEFARPRAQSPEAEVLPREREVDTQEQASTDENPQSKAVAELVDMGFQADKSLRALEQTETGVDVQAAVGILLNQAHEEAKQKTQRRAPDPERRQSPLNVPRDESTHRVGRREQPRQSEGQEALPAWMRSGSAQRRTDSQSPAGEKDVAQYASEIGNNLFKSANSLWKKGQKQVQRAVADFQQEPNQNQPKWMRDAASQEEPHPRHDQQRRPDVSARRAEKAPQRDEQMTDEAMMLEARDARPHPRQKQERFQSPASSGRLDNDRRPSPALELQPGRPSPQPRFMQQPQQAIDRRPAAKLTREAVEEQSEQAYISPARRKKATPKPEPSTELLSDGARQPSQPPRAGPTSPPLQSNNPFLGKSTPLSTKPSTPQPLSKPSTPIPVRPKAPTRSIPPTDPSALKNSANHRQQGTDAFKRGDYPAAHTAYTAALSPLPPSHPVNIVIFCNRALVNIKVGEPKAAVSDAESALKLIGPAKGESEVIAIGEAEGQKDMREFYGKALMRKAEALENMEKWAEAGAVWREAIESGVGGAVAMKGRERCEKAINPAPTAPPKPKPAPPKKPARSAMDDLAGRPTGPQHAQSTEAVAKLRAANAAAEKADDEKFALADVVDAKLVDWKGTKADNLRALLGSLDKVLWSEAGWKKVGMQDLVMPNKVKIVYMKAIAKVHPDKIPQDATTEQRMISAAVFSTLNEAWDKFKKDNNL